MRCESYACVHVCARVCVCMCVSAHTCVSVHVCVRTCAESAERSRLAEWVDSGDVVVWKRDVYGDGTVCRSAWLCRRKMHVCEM